MGQTVREDLRGRRGQQALVEVLGMLCRLSDEDRLEIVGCYDPEAVQRLADYAGYLHGEPRRLDDTWTVSLRRRGCRTLVE